MAKNIYKNIVQFFKEQFFYVKCLTYEKFLDTFSLFIYSPVYRKMKTE